MSDEENQEATKFDLGPGDVSVPAIPSGPTAVAPGNALPAKGKRRKSKKVKLKSTLGVGGSLSVRYMKDSQGEVALLGVIEMDASNTSADDKSPKWIQLATTGRFKGHSAGPFELSMDTFKQIIANFNEGTRRIPIDFNHASEQDPTQGTLPTQGAPAVGWIVDMKIDGGRLWGLVQWGDLARQYILSGGYRYFSPAIRFNSRDRVTGESVGARMSSGALTNDPFLSQLQPVCANFDEIGKTVDLAALIEDLEERCVDRSDEDESETDAPDVIAMSAATIEPPAASLTNSTATQAAMTTNDLSGHSAPTHEDIDMATLEEMTKLLASTQAQVAELNAQVATSKAELNTQLTAVKSELELSKSALAASETLVTTLSAEKAKREDADLGLEVDQAILTWGERKGIGEKNKQHLMNFRKADSEGFREMFPLEDPAKTKLLSRVVPVVKREDETVADTVSGESVTETITRLMTADRTLSKAMATNLAFKERGTAASLHERNTGRASINDLPPVPGFIPQVGRR